jgi:hypothetical protein
MATRLLVQDDPSRHYKAKYIPNGPEGVTGDGIVNMVEQHLGARVQSVSYKDMSMIDGMVEAAPPGLKSLVLSVKELAADSCWEGKCSASTTSNEALELANPDPDGGG